MLFRTMCPPIVVHTVYIIYLQYARQYIDTAAARDSAEIITNVYISMISIYIILCCNIITIA